MAKKYISEGYKAVIVLKFSNLSKSTYYYHISLENKIKIKSENVGRPIVDYSLTNDNCKNGYITGENKFFFVLSVIDVFDRSIIGYYMGYSCTGFDAANLLRHCLIKRNLFSSTIKPVIRTDNGPQFISHVFENSCAEIHVYHERIPSRTPNKNAHIESFQMGHIVQTKGSNPIN